MVVETLLLTVSILFFFSIMAGKAGSRFGVPALLLFLLVGMACGSDGAGIDFQNTQLAQAIGTVALCIILFSGGMDTKIADIRPVMSQGVILATAGVLLTTAITGVLVWLVLGATGDAARLGLLSSLLMAATMSSTDSASVFSILRSKGLRLKNNLRPMLELESGSNDPVAYILVITLIDLLLAPGQPNYLLVVGTLALQIVVGALSGLLLGKLALVLFNRVNIGKDLFPILVVATSIFIFSFTFFINGNSYLAVYVGGLVIGNSKHVHKRSTLRFFDGLAWICQLLMFLTLGLLVNPSELIPIVLPGLAVSFLMIFVARPASVFLCTLPFKGVNLKSKLFVSWVGLRGAVPIIFAIYPLAAGIPQARLMFNIVFFCTLVSLLVQGTTLPFMAKRLGLAEDPGPEPAPLKDFDVDFPDDIKSAMTEIRITAGMLDNGDRLMDLAMSDRTLAIMVKRADKFFVPTGKTQLHAGDVLLVITDDQESIWRKPTDEE